MVLSEKTQTDIKINEALAELFGQQKINMQGANAAIELITQSKRSPKAKKQQLKLVERAVATDQSWFHKRLEEIGQRFGIERVGLVMRTGIDLSEHTTH